MSLNVELVEQSFDKVKPRANEFAASFYENLFKAHPEVKPLFTHTDMGSQEKKLINSLVLVVENLRNPEALAPVLNALGSRHVGYGAIPKYYRPVGEALLLTFEQYLGEDWTPEVKKAWLDAYRAITALMLKGAHEFVSLCSSVVIASHLVLVRVKQSPLYAFVCLAGEFLDVSRVHTENIVFSAVLI